MVQRVKVIGRTVVCNKCKQSAEIYCACGTFLCTMHVIAHIGVRSNCVPPTARKYSRRCDKTKGESFLPA